MWSWIGVRASIHKTRKPKHVHIGIIYCRHDRKRKRLRTCKVRRREGGRWWRNWYAVNYLHVLKIWVHSLLSFSWMLGWILFSKRHFLYLVVSEDVGAQSLLNKLIRNNLVNTTNQVEVLQKDPNSPLYSVKSFEELRLWVRSVCLSW